MKNEKIDKFTSENGIVGYIRGGLVIGVYLDLLALDQTVDGTTSLAERADVFYGNLKDRIKTANKNNKGQ